MTKLDSRGMLKVSKRADRAVRKERNNIKCFEDISKEQLTECEKMYKSLVEDTYSDIRAKKRFKILKLPKEYFEDDFEFEIYAKYRCFNLFMLEKHNLTYNPRYKGYVIEKLDYIDFVMARVNQKKSCIEMQEEWLKTHKPTICPSQSMHGILNNDLWTYKSKSYINDQMDYESTLRNVKGAYDGLCFESSVHGIQISFKQKQIITEARKKQAFQISYAITQYNVYSDKYKTAGQISQIKIPALLQEFEFEIIAPDDFGRITKKTSWEKDSSVWDEFISVDNWDDEIEVKMEKDISVTKQVNVKVHTINPSMYDSILYGLNVDSINEIQKDINNNTTVFFGNRKEKENVFTPNVDCKPKVDLSKCWEEQKRLEKEKELWEEEQKRIKYEMDKIRRENIQREYYGDVVKNSKPLPTPPPLMPF